VAGKIAPAADPKSALRRKIIETRNALPPSARRELSARITRQLLVLDAYRNARCVLAYMCFGSEFDTMALAGDVLARGAQLCLPRIEKKSTELVLHHVQNLEEDLQSGVWGIREPRADRPIAVLDRIDFVLLPGVAFTPRCERLGYGGGFYDRLIARFARRPPLIAAAFELQICPEIPLDSFDQRVGLVVTESARYAQVG
jgi:5-formyltetrahydrofolate cyclo-ligase